ncbi:probable serine/threonine-protein kinase cdc7 [Anopheles marshallii]|uniref:probable serine/threonine-protein kinase cdc7 n=1 Tax=Anopheles marshallii TaxID=1521116 RepID=UPI00237BF0CB|nr:probable serine/threonine-protein kinase cdc7 [Anopheles marshallii]
MSQQLNAASHCNTMLGSIANSIGTNNSIACSMGNNIPNNLTTCATIPNSMIATMSSPAGNASNGPTSNGNSNGGTGANGSSNGPSSTPATPTNNCQSIRYCWEADKVKTLIRLRAELSPLFTGKRNASKYAWAVVERELSVPLPISKIIKKWNNLLQEYKAIKMSEEPKRREWPFFNLMDVYFSDQVNDPTLRLFSSTKRFDSDTLDDAQFDDEIMNSTAAAAIAAAAAASAAAANAASQHKIKNELIASHGHSGGSMLDISDIIGDEHGESKFDQFKREIVLSQIQEITRAGSGGGGGGGGGGRKEKNNNNKDHHNNNNSNNNTNNSANNNNNNASSGSSSNNNNNASNNTSNNSNHATSNSGSNANGTGHNGTGVGNGGNGNATLESKHKLMESLNLSPGGSHLTTSGVSSLSTTSSSSSARDEASSLNSSPTSHISSGPTNGPCGPEMRKMSNGPTADFSALLAAANSHTNGTLHSNSSALSSTDRDTDYDDYAERSSLYDGGNNHLKSLNQKLLHQMNEHHNIDQYLLSWRGFHGNMCKGFHSLQRDGQMVDVTIAAGGKIFKAHKLVLSVCSPYFQKIFLEHPSQHPILFMTDVNSHHMAGLLDFMYSGQVNVKYEDLPNFLKVAEALQVKGLHGESTNDSEERDYQQQQHQHALRLQEQQRLYHQQQQQQHQQQQQLHQQQQQQQQQQKLAQQRQQLLQVAQQQAHAQAQQQHQQQQQQQQQQAAAAAAQQQAAAVAAAVAHQQQQFQHHRNNFKELMKAKHAAAAVVLNEDYLNNNAGNANNNNNSMSNNNGGNNGSNGNANGPLSPYASKKMLDTQKYQKYYSKRKLVQQYEQEMRAEKRKLGIEDVIQAAAAANALNLRLNNGGSPIGSPTAVAAAAAAAAAALNPPGTPTNGGTSTDDEQQQQQHGQQTPVLLQNIKSEPQYDDEDEGMEVDQDNNNSLNAANANTAHNNNNNDDDYYGQHDQGVITTGNGKTIKHSILEPNIVLKQSDECLTTNNQTGSLNLCKNVS